MQSFNKSGLSRHLQNTVYAFIMSFASKPKSRQTRFSPEGKDIIRISRCRCERVFLRIQKYFLEASMCWVFVEYLHVSLRRCCLPCVHFMSSLIFPVVFFFVRLTFFILHFFFTNSYLLLLVGYLFFWLYLLGILLVSSHVS